MDNEDHQGCTLMGFMSRERKIRNNTRGITESENCRFGRYPPRVI